ncbi:radical SAM protein [Candidatus Aerophobetes bacterium]|nr:radical SAM protein [Candidatus Aerophobetes bacterium]
MALLLKKPTSEDKLQVLGKTAEFDVCGIPRLFSPPGKKLQRFKFIYPAVGKGGCVRLFKVLQTNFCEGNCFYCANRKDRDFNRISFSPDELARLFVQYHQRGLVDGLFLSSAIYGSPTQSQEQTFKTLYLVRKKYGYKGYIHYKVLPGCNATLMEKCAAFADRLSINLEAPGHHYLSKLSPTKNFSSQLLAGLEKIALLNKERPLKAGITTQFVVGAAGEKDKDILSLSNQLYRKYKLWRIYYSGFFPMKNTPLENIPPCPPLREFRIYQADFLLKGYGFTPEELPFEESGNLPRDVDPKLAWALSHPEKFPVEINRADYWELLRIPGVGRVSAKRVIKRRKEGRITTLEELKGAGCVVKRARNFVTLSGKFSPSGEKEERNTNYQLFLWEEI